MLIGHSFGGLLAVDIALNQKEIFENIIAISPSLWWKDDYFFKSPNKNSSDGFWYLSAGDKEPNNEQILRRFHQFLSTQSNHPQLEMLVEYNVGEDHFSNVPVSVKRGLDAFFPVYELVDQVIEIYGDKGLTGLHDWCDSTRKNLGPRFHLMASPIHSFALSQYRESKDAAVALELIDWTQSVFPSDYNSYYYEGLIREANGEKELSKVAFSKALEIGGMPERTRIVITRKLN